QRHPLPPALRRGLAALAARFAPVGDRLRLLSALGGGRDVGDRRHHPAPQGPHRAGPRSGAERGRPRQPDGEDDGKGGPRGYDAGKTTNGRNRHVLVETGGSLLRGKVQAADIQDREGAKLVLTGPRVRFPRLRKVWVDRNYRGALVAWAERQAGVEL